MELAKGVGADVVVGCAGRELEGDAVRGLDLANGRRRLPLLRPAISPKYDTPKRERASEQEQVKNRKRKQSKKRRRDRARTRARTHRERKREREQASAKRQGG